MCNASKNEHIICKQHYAAVYRKKKTKKNNENNEWRKLKNFSWNPKVLETIQNKFIYIIMTMTISDRIKEDLQTFYEKHLFEYSLNAILFSPIFYNFLLYLYKSCTSFCLHTYVSKNTFTHTHTHTQTRTYAPFFHTTPLPSSLSHSLSIYLVCTIIFSLCPRPPR